MGIILFSLTPEPEPESPILQCGGAGLQVWGCRLGLDHGLDHVSSTDSGLARQAGKRCPLPSELQQRAAVKEGRVMTSRNATNHFGLYD